MEKRDDASEQLSTMLVLLCSIRFGVKRVRDR